MAQTFYDPNARSNGYRMHVCCAVLEELPYLMLLQGGSLSSVTRRNYGSSAQGVFFVCFLECIHA